MRTLFTKQIPVHERRSKVRQARGERGLWQRRFWEHVIRNERDYAAHLDYVHYNPVKHGYAVRPADWAFSTFRRCVQRRIYAPDWGDGGAEDLVAGVRGE
jgi:putative transposase